MKRYSIFKKSSKFYWSNNRIVLPIIFGCIAILFVKSKILKSDANALDKYLIGIMVGAFFLGITLQLFRLAKPDPLKGTLDGFLSFEPERIVAGEAIYKIEEIKKVRITNDDYYGKSTGSGRPFNSGLSNGVDNVCEIAFLDGSTICYHYELYYPNDLQKSKKELTNYYRLGKIEINNLVDILGLSKSEIAEL